MKKKIVVPIVLVVITIISIVTWANVVGEDFDNKVGHKTKESSSVAYINSDGDLSIVLQGEQDDKTIVMEDYLENGLIRITEDNILYYQKTDFEVYMIDLKEYDSVKESTKITQILDPSDESHVVYMKDFTYLFYESDALKDSNDLLIISLLTNNDRYDKDDEEDVLEFVMYDYSENKANVIDTGVVEQSCTYGRIPFDITNNRLYYITESDKNSQIKYIDGELVPKLVQECNDFTYMSDGNYMVDNHSKLSREPRDFVYKKDGEFYSFSLDDFKVRELGSDKLLTSMTYSWEYTDNIGWLNNTSVTSSVKKPFIIYLTKDYYLKSKLIDIPYADLVEIDKNNPDKEFVKLLEQGSKEDVIYDLYKGDQKVVDNVVSIYIDGLNLENKFVCNIMNDKPKAKMSMEEWKQQYTDNDVNVFDIGYEECLVVDTEEGVKILTKEEIPELEVRFDVEATEDMVYIHTQDGEKIMSYKIDDTGKIINKDIALTGTPYVEMMWGIKSDYREDFLATNKMMGNSRMIVNGKTLKMYTEGDSSILSITRSGDIFLSNRTNISMDDEEVQNSYLYKYHNGEIVKFENNYKDYVVRSDGGVIISRDDEASGSSIIEIYDADLNKKTVIGDVDTLIDTSNSEEHILFCS